MNRGPVNESYELPSHERPIDKPTTASSPSEQDKANISTWKLAHRQKMKAQMSTLLNKDEDISDPSLPDDLLPTIDSRNSPCKSEAYSLTDEERSIVKSPNSTQAIVGLSSPELTVGSEEHVFHTSPIKSKTFFIPGEEGKKPKRKMVSISARDEHYEINNFGDEQLLHDTSRGITKLWTQCKNGSIEGMACFIQEEDKHYIYTCMHNFENEFDAEKKVLSFPYSNEKAMKKARLPFFTKARLPTREDTGEAYKLRGESQEAEELQGKTLEWDQGFEVVRFRIPDDAKEAFIFLHEHVKVNFLSLPDKEFQYVKGMKVAFLEWNIQYCEPPDNVRKPRPSHLGDQIDVNMFVGEIKFVGTKHIECDYNAFHGCSGGPVVCIDPEYEQSMGKVVAIHVGCKSDFHREKEPVEGYNVAFKIATEAVQKDIANSTVEEVRKKLTPFIDENTWYINNK